MELSRNKLWAISVNGRLTNAEYTDLKEKEGMLDSINYLEYSGRVWNFRPKSVQRFQGSTTLYKVKPCYKDYPLYAYNNTAITELAIADNSPIDWTDSYQELIDYTPHSGVYGKIHDNSLIDTSPYTDEEERYNVELRRNKEHYTGFIDSIFTPMSVEAGRVRSLCHSVRYFIPTPRTYDICRELVLLSVTDSNIEYEWLFAFAGCIAMISSTNAEEITNKWLNYTSVDRPQLHYFSSRKVLVLSCVAGCLLRPNLSDDGVDSINSVGDSSKFNMEGIHWYDSTMMSNDDMILRYGIKKYELWTPMECCMCVFS